MTYKRVFIDGLTKQPNKKLNYETIKIDDPLKNPDFTIQGPRPSDQIVSWDEFYITMAWLLAQLRSKEPKTRVGCIITDSKHHILTTGYNGTPRGVDDANMVYNNDHSYPVQYTKDSCVIHAECNALYNFVGVSQNLQNATLYSTLFPCMDCSKAIVSHGIGRVVFMEPPRRPNDGQTQAAFLNLKRAGIQVDQIFPSRRTLLMSIDKLNDLLNDLPD